jgi:sodium pump decarboxylase gamma subunit
MSNAILPQALVLLGAGMLIVFVFLYVLVLVMRGVALVVPRFNHILPDDAPKAPVRTGTARSTDDALVAVAIAVAADRARQ